VLESLALKLHHTGTHNVHAVLSMCDSGNCPRAAHVLQLVRDSSQARRASLRPTRELSSLGLGLDQGMQRATPMLSLCHRRLPQHSPPPSPALAQPPAPQQRCAPVMEHHWSSQVPKRSKVCTEVECRSAAAADARNEAELARREMQVPAELGEQLHHVGSAACTVESRTSGLQVECAPCEAPLASVPVADSTRLSLGSQAN
jgi:hypothetical protein